MRTLKPKLKGIPPGYAMDLLLAKYNAQLHQKDTLVGFYRLHELWVDKEGDFILKVPDNISMAEVDSLVN